jgi:MoaA/NifB/PqqE/SkfB family radical SAM enzyme
MLIGKVYNWINNRRLKQQSCKSPKLIQIHLDTICNRNCWFCLVKECSDKDKVFSMSDILKLENVVRQADTIMVVSFGEPLLSKHYIPVVKQIIEWNDKPDLIGLVTNGSLLNPEIASLLSGRISHVGISLNASTPETYKTEMGGDFYTTIEAIYSFVDCLSDKDRRKVFLHMVASTGNYHEIVSMVYLANDLHITDVRIHQVLVPNNKCWDKSLLNIKHEYNEVVDSASMDSLMLGISFTARKFGVEKSKRVCMSPWTETYIRAGGLVAPCCYNGNLFLGNAYTDGIENVWTGKAYNDFRKHRPLCASCSRVLPFDNPGAHKSPFYSEVK